MKVDIIPIGNSKGIRISKPLLEQCGCTESVDIKVENNSFVLRNVSEPRKGWDDTFRAMAENGDHALVDLPATFFDEQQWEW